tara:strand:+ start:6182 stop:6913 length:732 start_codon:yes stop_codon:yes gene_type:complete
MNDDLTILPIKPEDNELKQTRELHPNLPNVYKGQLLALVGGVRMGKGTLWNNMLHNPNFYEGLFENVNIISPTIWNDSTSRFSAKKFKDTCYDRYDDTIIDNLVKNQKSKKEIDGADTSYALIVDDSYNEFNKVGRKGGAVLRLASRFRHYVRKGDPCLYLYSTQKYLDLLPMIRANATGIIISGMIKNRKELDTLAYDLDDTFGGQFETIMEHARGEPYQWIYFRLDSTPPEAYLNFKDKVF